MTTDAAAPEDTTQNAAPAGDVLLSVENLKVYFPVTAGLIFQRKVADIKAVDGITFQIRKGETLGLVGESGWGKSTTGRAILQLYRPTDGQLKSGDIALTEPRSRQIRRWRRDAHRRSPQRDQGSSYRRR